MAKQKHLLRKVMLGEFLFWLHAVVIILITISGLFVAWWWVLLILVLMKAQQFVFHNCIITFLELEQGSIPRGMTYYSLAAKRFLGFRLSRRGVRAVSFLQIALTILITLAANLFSYRAHI